MTMANRRLLPRRTDRNAPTHPPTTGQPVDRSGHLARWGTLALAAALSLLLAGPARVARAEVLDFDPVNDEVPTIVSEAELAAIQALKGAAIQYLFAPPSPDGRWAYGFTGEGVGFVNLDDGTVVPAAEDPGQPVGDLWWVEDGVLGQVTLEQLTDDQGEPTEWRLTPVRLDAATGALTRGEPVTWPLRYNPLGASPDLSWVLALEVPTGTAVKHVTLRPSYGPPSPLPEGLPGVAGSLSPASIDLQQAPSRLVLRSLDGAEQKVLTELPADSGLWNFLWSTDGRRLTVLTATMPDWDGDRQRNNDPPAAGLPNLGSINVQESLGLVRPEDNPLLTGTRLHVFDAASGASVKVLENRDFPAGRLARLDFNADSSQALLVILKRSELEGRPHPTYANPSGLGLWLLDASLNPVREITGPDVDSLSSGGGWLDKDTVYLALAHELDTRLALYETGTQSWRTVWSAPGSSWQVTAGGGRLVFPHSTVNAPMELYHLDPASPGASPQAVTQDNAALAGESRLKTARITWTSGGRTLEGLYVFRDDMPFPPATPGPVVVWQQGGPGGQMVNDFGTSVESPYSLLPQFGIPVFMANAAGRSVQDAQFFSDMAEGRNFGQLDIQQIKEGVEALVARKIVDRERVGITGCSYGGYFTLQSIRTYPDFYAAANAQCSLTDLFEEFTFGYTPFVSYLMGRAPTADPEEYAKDSPLYGSKDVRTPTLLFHGSEDFLPVALIANYHDQLEEADVPVQFLRVAGEGHGLGMPNSQLYAAQLQLEFFRSRIGVADTSPARPQPVFLPVAYREP
jgi:dipeptidyl aminopeptidase/acylaminoacyl peptidase